MHGKTRRRTVLPVTCGECRAGGVARGLVALVLGSLLLGAGAGARAESGDKAVVDLDPGAAALEGEARNKCWSGKCYWVVWCGHDICDGSWSWRFPAQGSYEIIWEHVSYKCAGSPPYELRINDETVRAGRLAQYGACGSCTPGGIKEVFRDTSLGEYSLERGDKITLYVRNDFACGIEGPGAYAAFKGFSAERRD